MRTFAPVIVRGEESQGVKFWGFGKTVYQELLSIIADPDYGDITEIYQEQSYDDLTGILNEWLNPNDDASTQEVKKETVSTSELGTSKVKDTSEAFDELFNS